MNVYKFGGTSQKDRQSLQQCIKIIRDGSVNDIVIVSAPAGVTDLLIQGFDEQTSTGEFTRETFEKIQSRFFEVHPEQEKRAIIESGMNELELRISQGMQDGFGTEQLKDLHYARIASFGEFLEPRLFSENLKMEGIRSRVGRIEQTMRVHGPPRNAKYDRCSDPRILEEVSGFDGVTVFSGFYGFDSDGNILVFSRGGSDFTQTLVSRAVNADACFNCTDVNGVFPINPNLLTPNAAEKLRTIPELQYEQAQELSKQGAKVLHPKCIEPLKEKGIPLYVINTFDPLGPNTVIGPESRAYIGVNAVTGRKQAFTKISLTTGCMDGATGYLQNFANSFEGVDVETISTSAIELSAGFSDPTADTDLILERLAQYGTAKKQNGQSMIAIVGKGIGRSPAIIGKFFSTLGVLDIPVDQITKSNDYCLWVSIPQHHYERAMVGIYNAMLTRQ
ncbi:aspartate kinase [Candidatus Woesearchaeota archaeon]|jgi:aspartate kinase|nr:aspartate kinase [Candidatus Woesearchaeota archaeon]